MSLVSCVTVETPTNKTSIQAVKKWNQIIKDLGTSIREKGHLVVIPTETVYGLGGNAFDKNSVLKIFEAKERPLNDPVICHVADVESAETLYDCSEVELIIIRILAEEFWPGPLSIVAKSSQLIPKEVTANTGFVAVRIPRNSVALNLIKAAEVPIAAPSANKFGKISPSCAEHVKKSFKHLNLKTTQSTLTILDDGPSTIGIESTVCKITLTENNQLLITLLRRGAISNDLISNTITQGIENLNKKFRKNLNENINKNTNDNIDFNKNFEILKNFKVIVSDNIKFELNNNYPKTTSEIYYSPGMLLSHYSPSIPTYLLKENNFDDIMAEKNIYVNLLGGEYSELSKKIQINECIIIDIFKKFLFLKKYAADYFELNLENENKEFNCNLFDCLHKAEDIAVLRNFKFILITDFQNNKSKEQELAIYDRVFRAASGRHAILSY